MTPIPSRGRDEGKKDRGGQPRPVNRQQQQTASRARAGAGGDGPGRTPEAARGGGVQRGHAPAQQGNGTCDGHPAPWLVDGGPCQRATCGPPPTASVRDPAEAWGARSACL